MPEQRIQLVSLSEINGGSVIARFAEDLDQIVRNIRDVNTDPTKVRKIVHTFIFKPNHSRTQCGFEFDSKLVLARPVPATSMLFVGIDRDGTPVATEYNYNQPTLPMYERDVTRASGGEVTEVTVDSSQIASVRHIGGRRES